MMKIDSFTISYSFDAGNSGRRASNFVSVNFKLHEPTNIEDVEIMRAEASKKVTVWAIQDALMRGEISSDEAKSRLEIVKSNFDGLKASLSKKVES
jgi:hypothetical protein